MKVPNGVWPFLMMLVELNAEFEHVNRKIIVGKGRYFRALEYADIDRHPKPAELAKEVWNKVLGDWTYQQAAERGGN